VEHTPAKEPVEEIGSAALSNVDWAMSGAGCLPES
jgi:hypothetical protein